MNTQGTTGEKLKVFNNKSNKRPLDASHDNCSNILGKSEIEQSQTVYSVSCLINESLRILSSSMSCSK